MGPLMSVHSFGGVRHEWIAFFSDPGHISAPITHQTFINLAPAWLEGQHPLQIKTLFLSY